jgi:hypothetical protein
MKGVVGEDVLTGFILIFIIALVSVAAWYLYSTLIAVPQFAAPGPANTAMGYVGTTISMFDGLIAVMVAAIGIGSIASGIMVRSHPVVFVVMIAINGVTALICSFFTNVFVTLSSTALSSSIAHFAVTGMIIQYFPLVSLAMSFIAAIAVFSTRGSPA